MKHYIIITNKGKDPKLEVTKQVESLLEQMGCTSSVYSEESSSAAWVMQPEER